MYSAPVRPTEATILLLSWSSQSVRTVSSTQLNKPVSVEGRREEVTLLVLTTNCEYYPQERVALSDNISKKKKKKKKKTETEKKEKRLQNGAQRVAYSPNVNRNMTTMALTNMLNIMYNSITCNSFNNNSVTL
jgi:hypothetical protein